MLSEKEFRIQLADYLSGRITIFDGAIFAREIEDRINDIINYIYNNKSVEWMFFNGETRYDNHYDMTYVSCHGTISNIENEEYFYIKYFHNRDDFTKHELKLPLSIFWEYLPKEVQVQKELVDAKIRADKEAKENTKRLKEQAIAKLTPEELAALRGW